MPWPAATSSRDTCRPTLAYSALPLPGTGPGPSHGERMCTLALYRAMCNPALRSGIGPARRSPLQAMHAPLQCAVSAPIGSPTHNKHPYTPTGDSCNCPLSPPSIASACPALAPLPPWGSA